MPTTLTEPDRHADPGPPTWIPFTTLPAVALAFLVAPPIGALVFGDGHPSGRVIGFAVALVCTPALGMYGIAASVQAFRRRRRNLILLAIALNALFVILPFALCSVT